MNIVDRRPNPKNKSLSNRQRFLGRARTQVQQAVSEAIRKRKVADVASSGEKIKIPTGGINEPTFHHSRRAGKHDMVVPGNKEFVRDDEIPRPQGGGDGGGREGSPDGSGEDAFEFTLSKEEFLDLFFEDLELPDLVRKSLRDTKSFETHHAGFTITDTGSLSVPRTMKNSMARRIAVKRPKPSEMENLKDKLEAVKAELTRLNESTLITDPPVAERPETILELYAAFEAAQQHARDLRDGPHVNFEQHQQARLNIAAARQKLTAALYEAIETCRADNDTPVLRRLYGDLQETLQSEYDQNERRQKSMAYVDPLDVRHRRFERIPKPNSEAVMFCLMDVSGSMTEAMKDLAKRFFMLLYVFLTRNYRHVDVVFIRHTSTAEEVDEETFFYSRETGGTVVSSALDKMLEIARARYPTNRWNIYGAHASDGDNYGADSSRCLSLMDQDILPMSQYFAYIETGDGMSGGLSGLSRDSDLWRAYAQVKGHGKFAMRRVGDPKDIFPVFHELFRKGAKELAALEAPAVQTVRLAAPDLTFG